MKRSILMLLASASAFVLGSVPVSAQEQQLPERPDRVVKQEAGQEVEEIRIEGRLDSVRVKPRIGPEYFIDDRAGDGTLSSTGGGEMDSSFNIRTWKLGEW